MSCIGAVWQAVLGKGFVDASPLLASTSCTCFEHKSGKRSLHQGSEEYKNHNAILTCLTLKQLTSTMNDLTSHDVSVTTRSRVSSSTVSVKTWNSSCASWKNIKLIIVLDFYLMTSTCTCSSGEICHRCCFSAWMTQVGEYSSLLKDSSTSLFNTVSKRCQFTEK